jgi:hypothetical protein
MTGTQEMLPDEKKGETDPWQHVRVHLMVPRWKSFSFTTESHIQTYDMPSCTHIRHG